MSPELCLRRRTPCWWVRFRIGDQEHRRSTGTRSEEEASIVAAKLYYEAATRGPEVPGGDRTTLGGLFSAWDATGLEPSPPGRPHPNRELPGATRPQQEPGPDQGRTRLSVGQGTRNSRYGPRRPSAATARPSRRYSSGASRRDSQTSTRLQAATRAASSGATQCRRACPAREPAPDTAAQLLGRAGDALAEGGHARPAEPGVVPGQAYARPHRPRARPAREPARHGRPTTGDERVMRQRGFGN